MNGETLPLAVMLVDDEEALLRSTRLVLRAAGIDPVLTEGDARRVIGRLAREPVGLILLDLTMPHLGGEALLVQVAREYPEIGVIMLTASDDLDTAVRCMQQGAVDYLVKPVERSRLVSAVQRALELGSLRAEVASLRDRLLDGKLHHPEVFDAIVTRSPAMLAIFRYLEAIAASRRPVLISGETGTGKELIARAVHAASGLSGEFVAENVAGLDDNVFADTLFGHRKGAFTTADQAREGLIARAAHGTLFLDEIGDLSETSQIKLLRLLQEGNYYPLGADRPRRSEARVVVATHRDIPEMVREGKFRKDLYFRLRTHHLQLPALRQRPEDLPLLVEAFVERAAVDLGKEPPPIPTSLFGLLRCYAFPGNIRELEDMVFDAVARHQQGLLSLESFQDIVALEDIPVSGSELGLGNFTDSESLPTLKEAEALLIQEALRRAEGHQGNAARLLGITRQALNKRLLRERRG